jgi:hypothetical protein
MTRWHNGLGLLSLIILFALAASDPIDLPPLGWLLGGAVAGGFLVAYAVEQVRVDSGTRKGAK